eukprot:643116-Pelagomonas_calceolata.AAC.1
MKLPGWSCAASYYYYVSFCGVPDVRITILRSSSFSLEPLLRHGSLLCNDKKVALLYMISFCPRQTFVVEGAHGSFESMPPVP